MDFLGIAGGLLGGLFGGDDAQATQTQDRSPWIGAQPWINSNITAGQGLQDYYTANPFNQGQRQAYGNMAATSDYVRSQIPQLLGTLNQQGGGFDRNNVNARPPSFQFGNGGSNLGLGPAYGGTGGAASQANTADIEAMLKRAQMAQSVVPAPVAPQPQSTWWESYDMGA